MMEQLKEMLTKELEEIASKGKMTAGELDTVDKLTHSLKSLETIMAMSGYSNDGGSYGTMSYENRNRGSYGGSYARKRDSMGRYSRGYSRTDMREELHALMEDAETEQEREAIRRCIEQMR